jgi:hypothetical protein
LISQGAFLLERSQACLNILENKKPTIAKRLGHDYATLPMTHLGVKQENKS